MIEIFKLIKHIIKLKMIMVIKKYVLFMIAMIKLSLKRLNFHLKINKVKINFFFIKIIILNSS